MKNWMDFLAMVVLIGIIAFLWKLPAHRCRRGGAREMACYANMRVILGAIEMYNMDHPVMVNRVDQTVLEQLRAGKYLRYDEGPFCYGYPPQYPLHLECLFPDFFPAPRHEYSSIGDLTGTGAVCCPSHGTVE
ncbi:MAG: hypothetical protein GX442_15460 [Candidatus Riflebacteria bacterium]|nr:hypothetical protein [Candidatus Riflebacteria bacterium]